MPTERIVVATLVVRCIDVSYRFSGGLLGALDPPRTRDGELRRNDLMRLSASCGVAVIWEREMGVFFDIASDSFV
jgi:hypothetical protein